MTKPQCNQTNMTLWVEALESGKYAQIDSDLKTDLGYCCLGVVAELAGQTFIPDHRAHPERAHRYVAPDGITHSMFPGREVVVDWLGLSPGRSAIEVGGYDVRVDTGDESASGMNDAGASFATIAAALRERYLPEPKAARRGC